MKVCVYGSSSTKLAKIYYDEAYELGRQMAERGIGLVFGGGAEGLMGATARGVSDHEGYVLGVAPDFFDIDGVLFPKCTEFIYTKTMRERKQIMEDNAEAFIVTPGGIGTFEEFFEMLTLKQLKQTQKAIVILNTAGYYDTMLAFIQRSMDENFTMEACKKLFFVAATQQEALDFIECYNPEEVLGKYEKYTYDKTK